MSPEELLRAILAGMPLDGAGLEDRGDLEKLIKGVLPGMTTGAQDPAAYDDVETGRKTINLPSTPLMDTALSYDPSSVEYAVALGAANGASRSQVVASIKEKQAEAAEIDNGGPLNDDQQEAWDKAWAQTEKNISSEHAALTAERNKYDTDYRQLPAEARAATDAGQSTFEQVEYGPSKARKYWSDQGLSAPTDPWEDSHFGVDQIADQISKRAARDQFLAIPDVRATMGDSYVRPREMPGTGAPSHLAKGSRSQQAEMQRALQSRQLSKPEQATRAKRHAAGDALVAANRGAAANKAFAERMAQVLAERGRTPLTEQIRARLGQ